MTLHRTIGNQAVGRLIRQSPAAGSREPVVIQPKLTISEPNDIYEQEADRVAEQVMRMPDDDDNSTSPIPQSPRSPQSAIQLKPG